MKATNTPQPSTNLLLQNRTVMLALRQAQGASEPGFGWYWVNSYGNGEWAENVPWAEGQPDNKGHNEHVSAYVSGVGIVDVNEEATVADIGVTGFICQCCKLISFQ